MCAVCARGCSQRGGARSGWESLREALREALVEAPCAVCMLCACCVLYLARASEAEDEAARACDLGTAEIAHLDHALAPEAVSGDVRRCVGG